MAITAKFQADFSSFLEAIDKAEAELVDFSEGAARVEKSLNRMTDGFSGRKVIQDMILMATALEQVGGASILTTQELQAMGVKADAAIAKMKAIGVEVPPGIQKLSDLSRGAAEETLRLGAAADKAAKQVADEAAAASKLNQALNQFSGQKVIQEATVMARAIEQAGGASKLTANELQRAGAQASEAADKLKKLGLDVPPGIQHISDLARGAAEETLRLGDATKAASQKTNSGLKEMLGSASQLAGAFGIAFGAGQVLTGIVNFGKELLASAEALNKLHDKTGISVQGLQLLQSAGADAGNTLDQITNSVNIMQQRIAGNDASAVSALIELGINFTKFKALNPDEQFIEIGNAIAKVKDPADQVRLAVELFGKSGAEVLPTLKRGMDDLKESTVTMSNESVAALARASNALTKFFNNAKASIGEGLGQLLQNPVGAGLGPLLGGGTGSVEGLKKFKEEILPFRKQVDDAAAALRRFSETPLPTFDAAAIEAALEPIDEMQRRFHKLAEDAVKNAQALKAFNAVLADVTSHSAKFAEVVETIDGQVVEGVRFYVQRGASLEKLGIIYGLTAGQVKALGELFKSEQLGIELARFDANLANVAANTDRLGDNLKGLSVDLKGVSAGWIANQKALDDWFNAAARGADESGELLKNLRGLSVALPKVPKLSFGQDIGKSLTDSLKGVPQMLASAFTGGGGIGGALKGIGSSLGASVGGSVGKGISSAVTGIGALAGPIGAAIGSLAGPAIELFGKLFENPEKKINPIRQAFVDMAGGLDTLNKKAHDAGVTLDAMLNAKNPEQYEKAIQDLNAAFERQAKHVKDVGDGLKKAAVGTNAFAKSLLGPLEQMQDELDKLTTAGGKANVSLAKLLLKDPGKKDADAAKFGMSLADQVFDAFKEVSDNEEIGRDLSKKFTQALADVQPAFEHLGQYVAATFAAQIHEGASAFDAFQSLAPAFADLQAGVKDFGLTSTKTIDQLLKIQGVVGANKDVSDSVQALSDIYDGLTQAGYLTKDLFESFAEDISYQFDLLVSRGADGTTALQLMQPELQKLWEGQQKFGEITDESTKALLDQAEKQGLVGEDMKNVNDKILDVLLSIADVFGAKLPKSLQAMVDQTKKAQVEAQKALDAIHAPDITIGVHFNVDDQPDFSGGFEPIRMARGGQGVVNKPTLFLAGEQGREPFAFGDAAVNNGGSNGGGRDETPGLLRELIELMRQQPKVFRDAAMGAAV